MEALLYKGDYPISSLSTKITLRDETKTATREAIF